MCKPQRLHLIITLDLFGQYTLRDMYIYTNDLVQDCKNIHHQIVKLHIKCGKVERLSFFFLNMCTIKITPNHRHATHFVRYKATQKMLVNVELSGFKIPLPSHLKYTIHAAGGLEIKKKKKKTK